MKTPSRSDQTPLFPPCFAKSELLALGKTSSYDQLGLQALEAPALRGCVLGSSQNLSEIAAEVNNEALLISRFAKVELYWYLEEPPLFLGLRAIKPKS
ncbi:hypothetical protein ACU8KH_01076 [Lachancea thermotolerans]